MPFDNGDRLIDPHSLEKLEQSHVGGQFADVTKSPYWDHEVLKRNARENVVDQNSVDVIILDLVKVSDDVRSSTFIYHEC